MNLSRTCNRCHQTKDLTQFHKHPTCKGGRRPSCIACIIKARDPETTRQNTIDWKTANPERVRKHNRQGFRRWRKANKDFRNNRCMAGLAQLANENIEIND